MMVSKNLIGRTIGHDYQAPKSVYEYTLNNNNGLSVKIWTLGASLIEVNVVDWLGQLKNVVLRLPSLNDYESPKKHKYLGATLGRFARCINLGQFFIDNISYQLKTNFGNHHFHGGPYGFNQFVWDAQESVNSNNLSLCLSLSRPDGDQGYPGEVNVQTTYRIFADNKFSIEYTATTSASTIISLTNHSYWNLAGTGNINDHLLHINANKVIHTNQELIPSGVIDGVANTELDFRKERPISNINMDNFFVLNQGDCALTLFDPKSKRLMKMSTNDHGIAIYTADGNPHYRTGICLQPSAFPDAPNHQNFPSAQLDPNSTYSRKTIYEFIIE